ncbi:glyoxalase [Enterococcus rivorum]|uniref:Glyoxalase n=2 Tax=Enterococcus rivorum TaxID=762845 RepID=A0A1E5KYY9_9ENTE|nr:glyoxalase [Enterococcus rivorum]
MTYRLPSDLELKEITLKVENLAEMVSFYTTIIGLSLIKQTDNLAFLGIKESTIPLLILNKIERPINKMKTAGLYHIAFLLPTRKDLGNSLLWLLQNKIEIGAGEHGYSEALYLSDPEGNGIEIYRDRPIEEWDIRSNGDIIGVVEELDSEGIMATADGHWSGFPEGTKIGHVHFQVSDLEASDRFFKDLGFSLKANFGKQAKFFAAGDYHHHIGANTWAGRKLPKMDKNQLGIDAYVFELPDKNAYVNFKAHLDLLAIAYKIETENRLEIEDPNGITAIFTAKK